MSINRFPLNSRGTNAPVPENVKDCSGKHKRRLLVGEGNFSFAEAFIEKHDKRHDSKNSKNIESLGSSIIATELKKDFKCEACKNEKDFKKLCGHCQVISFRLEKLEKKRVTILQGIDATQLHTYKELTEKGKIPRIHWNCPHDGKSYKEQTLPLIISNFFSSCRKIQEEGSRVHITLAQAQGEKDFRQGYVYNIVSAATSAGYVLIKKRKFSPERYKGYEHTQAERNEKADVTNKGMREFVFQKVKEDSFIEAIKKAEIPPQNEKEKLKCDPFKLANALKDYSPKKPTINTREFYQESRLYYWCSTDEDSSDCEE